MSIRRPLASALVAVALPLLLLTACGDDEADSAQDPATGSASPTDEASATPEEPAVEGPVCDEVWVEGATLPAAYAGCVADGALTEPDRLPCSSGQTIVRFAEQYYAVLGGEIKFAEDLAKDPDYRRSVTVCRG